MKTITSAEFRMQLMAQGVSTNEHFAFICPICKTVQSGMSLVKAGAGAFKDIQTQVGFSCVGRFTKAGPHKKDAPPGKGCDWTLGGLFKLHTLEVADDQGRQHPFFEVATPEQAQALEASWRTS
jgi:hypothetical protein